MFLLCCLAISSSITPHYFTCLSLAYSHLLHFLHPPIFPFVRVFCFNFCFTTIILIIPPHTFYSEFSCCLSPHYIIFRTQGFWRGGCGISHHSNIISCPWVVVVGCVFSWLSHNMKYLWEYPAIIKQRHIHLLLVGH